MAPLAFAAKRMTKMMELKERVEGLRKRKEQKEGAGGRSRRRDQSRRKKQKE